ncbi:MAG: Ig-like domain-containing protein [Alistipes sp.]|jgi:uncharacterized protein (TIGR02145 family)|nr:Ig-like domain-containing protein [Alistipes sp.]
MKKLHTLFLFVALAAISFSSCGENKEPEPGPETVAVTGVTLDIESDVISIGETLVLTQTIAPSNASVKSVTWDSSDKTVATVTDGVVKGLAVGKTTITVTTLDGGLEAECAIEVAENVVPVERVVVDIPSKILERGEELQLAATVLPSTATNKGFSWSSEDPTVATVSQTGLVKAVKGGFTKIVATTVDNAKTAACELTVNVPVEGISLDKTEKTTVAVGGTTPFTVIFDPVDATVQEFTFMLDKVEGEDIATAAIDPTDPLKIVVTGVKTGGTYLRVSTVDGKNTTSCAIEVVQLVEGITLTPDDAALFVGGSTTLTVDFTPETTTDKRFKVESDDTSVATAAIDPEDGSKVIVTAIGDGQASITVTSLADETKTATCVVTVETPSNTVESISVDQPTLTVLSRGATQILIATVSPETATNKEFTVESSVPTVATAAIDPADQTKVIVTGVKAGETTITLTTVDQSKTATCVVTVEAAPHIFGTISFESATTYTVGNQIWSDYVTATYCKKGTFSGTSADTPDCRQNTGYYDLFSWSALANFGDVLCPDGWRAPVLDDFNALAQTLNGSTANHVDTDGKYISEWGGEYGGGFVTNNMEAPGSRGYLWGASVHAPWTDRGTYFLISPAPSFTQIAGMQIARGNGYGIRCVKNVE